MIVWTAIRCSLSTFPGFEAGCWSARGDDCGRTFRSAQLAVAAGLLRDKATAEGWTFPGHEALCPACTEKHAAGVPIPRRWPVARRIPRAHAQGSNPPTNPRPRGSR